MPNIQTNNQSNNQANSQTGNHTIADINNHATAPSRWEYQPVGTQCFHPDIGSYRTYGLQVYQNTGQQRVPVLLLQDISTRQDSVENMAVLFTFHQLSPVHLHDAVLDMLP